MHTFSSQNYLVVTCRSLPESQNRTGGLAVSYSNGTRYLSVATYRCDGFFYSIVGNNTERMCTADGNWTGIEPYCESNNKKISSKDLANNDLIKI